MSLTLLKPAIYDIMSLKGYVMGRFLDLTGHVFGRLTILERAKNISSGRTRWVAKCECGKQVVVTRNDLRAGDTNSCGCLKKELATNDLTNQRFGKLIAIEQAVKRGKSSSQFWLCKCDCGNEHIASSQHLRENQVKSCGCWFDKSEEDQLKDATERFWNKVERTGSCWTWKGPLMKGYGAMFYKKVVKAHRFSYEIHKGEIEKNKFICHTCDNPLCVNPEHLYAGTAKENTQDCIKRGRFKTRGKTIK
jgi:hypothetical protein